MTTALPILRVALEWFLNPDHLPLLWAQEQAKADDQFIVELIAPDDHYDGFADLATAKVDAVVNEPLHLIEQQLEGQQLQSLGTFFHTEGGILMQRSAYDKVRAGETIRITSPVSNPVTDGLCHDILLGYWRQQGLEVSPEQFVVYEGGFDHVAQLQKGADAAWLAFANIEGVHVKYLGLAVDMISTDDGGVPGFSALELITSRNVETQARERLAKFVEYLDAAVPALIEAPQGALTLWYRASNAEPSELTEALIQDTLKRFIAPVRPDASRWRPIWQYMQSKGADIVTEDEFETIFK